MTTTLPQPAASGAPDPEAIREVWEDAPGIPGFFDQLQRDLDDLKRRFFGP